MKNKSLSLGLLGILIALISFLAWIPGPFPFLLAIQFIPLFLIWDQESPLAYLRPNKKYLIPSLLFYSIIQLGFILYWISEVNIGAALYVIFLGAFMNSLCFLFLFRFWSNASDRLSRYFISIGFIAIWLGMEFIRERVFSLPWIHLGMGLSPYWKEIQWYSFTGPLGGSLWILVLNFAIYEALLALLRSIPTRKFSSFYSHILFLLAIIFIPILISWDSLNSRSHFYQRTIQVATVQTFINPRRTMIRDELAQLILLSKPQLRSNTEYLVWPENALGFAGSLDEEKIHFNPLIIKLKQFIQPYKNLSLVMGATTYKLISDQDTLWFNSSLQIENGDRISIYHKQILVPGIEKPAFSFPSQKYAWNEENPPIRLEDKVSAYMYLGGISHYFSEDGRPQVLYAQSGNGLGALICFESVFNSYARNLAIQGAGLFAVQSNDSWYPMSAGTIQHRDYSRILAISNHRSLIQSTNGGPSFLMSPKGEIIKDLDKSLEGGIQASLDLEEDPSFYSLHGDYMIFILPILLVLWGLLVLIRLLPALSWNRSKIE